MQWLAEICVRRPVFTWVMALSLVVVGASSVVGLGVDRFPDINFPIITVTTVLPGASPEQMETEVSDPIEEELNAIAGLDELTSRSLEGASIVMARFELEKDLGEASEEVRDAVARIVSDLPEGAEPPRVQRIDPDAAPVMLIAIHSTRDPVETTDFAERELRRRLESLNGVGGIALVGGREREIQVIVDPEQLAALSLTARDVQLALASENIEIPGGEVEQGRESLQLRISGRIEDPSAFAQVPVAVRGERTVRIADVATVRDTGAEPESIATVDGEPVVMLAVRKQSGTNTVAVVAALRERVAEISQNLPPSYKLEIVRDESEFISNAIEAVEEHLVLGGLLAALVVLVFLRNGRSTIIAALAIPTSIIATFALIAALGLTLNTITLLALTLSVGIVIDDAIVVLENIVRFMEEKRYTPARAAVFGTREIGLAVLATSLSLVAVFLPIAFMGGIVGRFLESFGFTMSFAVVVSLFIAFTLTPMLCSRWLRGSVVPEQDALAARAEARHGPRDTVGVGEVDPESEHVSTVTDQPLNRAEEKKVFLAWQRGKRSVKDIPGHSEGGHEAERRGPYGVVERGYLKLLALSMRFRWVVALVLVISLAALVPLVQVVPKNFLPNEDESRFEVTIRAPEGTSLAQTQLIGERIARAIRKDDAVAMTALTTGAEAGDLSGRGQNEASLYVSLKPVDARPVSQDEVMSRLRDQVVSKITPEGVMVLMNQVAAIGGGGQEAAPVQYVLAGPNLDKLQEYTDVMLERVRELPQVAEASTSLISGRPALDVRIDRRRAADAGVTVADAANALRLLVGGVAVTDFSEAGERYDVLVRAEPGARNQAEALGRITLPSSRGGTAHLSDIATIEPGTGPAQISHLGRQRQSTLFINTVPGASEQAIIDELQKIQADLHMAPGYSGQLYGRSRELGRALNSFLMAVFLSFVFMYLVLAAQFESWIHPITILASLPLTLPFAVFSVWVLGQSLNIYSMLGVLVLFGVVKKNAILQIDHMRGLTAHGLSRADAIMVANRDRLRPILMTTVAFVAGMLPLLLSSGAGAGTNRAMSSVIAGGQTLSLLLTLIAAPVLYSALDDLSRARWVRTFGNGVLWPLRRLDRLVSRQPEHEHEPTLDAAEE